ncbi:pre-mRNA-splicing factor CWC22 [Pyrus ussuriensis x Pyrus communis]|uniref:Pre-mRNA-splicing factor CWC22 n=1 Tax=Pyrus ussuriensis x Pyrus communis TaxID=2448454 RepID=A0A5N5FF75_9ROSA|nr:pre-mRNA-splicing factor CWC22 [Pyrus ussuriensis x Pyrus communis]
MWWGLGPGCDNLVSKPIHGPRCADEDFGPLRGWIVRSHIAQGCGSWMWLSDLTRNRYEVREKKCVKKRKRRGLKGMDSLASDSE